jgi:formate transporter
MDTVKPADVVVSLINGGVARSSLRVSDMLIRGAISGGLLGVATSLAVTATAQTGLPIVGALIFPVGFVMIVIMGFELVTGSFAVMPLAVLAGRVSARAMLTNIGWVFLGNLIGSVAYALLFVITATNAWTAPLTAGIPQKIVQIAEAKTVGYEALGAAGMLTVFVRAILCNWMVCMGVVMSMTSTATIGRLVAAWLPITIFFGQGFEHSVVNMFVIPAGMMMGAKVSFGDWWLWNQIPVTLGNVVGGAVPVAIAFYATFVRSSTRSAPASAVAATGD